MRKLAPGIGFVAGLAIGAGIGWGLGHILIGLGLGAGLGLAITVAIGFPMNRPWGYREGGEPLDDKTFQHWVGGDSD